MKPNASARIDFALPADFTDRCKGVRSAVEGSQAMTVQQLADALGLPFEFVAVAIGLTQALMSGAVVIIDPAALAKQH